MGAERAVETEFGLHLSTRPASLFVAKQQSYLKPSLWRGWYRRKLVKFISILYAGKNVVHHFTINSSLRSAFYTTDYFSLNHSINVLEPA